MSRRNRIARSITKAVVGQDKSTKDQSIARRFRSLLKALCTLYSVQLRQHAADDFVQLRQKWHVDPEHYLASFEAGDRDGTALQTKASLGYSGSTFFTTADGKYMVKSVPRRFEYSFFKYDFLPTYVQYMDEHLDSLIIRIVDFLAVEDVYSYSPGILLGLTPSHHLIMENLFVGRDEGQARGKEILHRTKHESSRQDQNSNDKIEDKEHLWKWETWDLKPTTYFFPERDIAGGKLTSELTKSKLADKLYDKLSLKRSDADKLMEQLREDTKLLENANVVDYSLFLVRIPIIERSHSAQEESQANENPFVSEEDDEVSDVDDTTDGPDLSPTVPTPSKPPFTPPGPPSWRTGVRNADGKYVYRAAILDFFWAKHKIYAKMMTKLVKGWNCIDPGGSKGPMSITTNSNEYRERFLSMCEGFIEVREEDDST